jgi:hypothetical protein
MSRSESGEDMLFTLASHIVRLGWEDGEDGDDGGVML